MVCFKFEAPCRSPWRRSNITGSLGISGPDPKEHMGKTGLDRVNMSKVSTFELFASDQASYHWLRFDPCFNAPFGCTLGLLFSAGGVALIVNHADLPHADLPLVVLGALFCASDELKVFRRPPQDIVPLVLT